SGATSTRFSPATGASAPRPRATSASTRARTTATWKPSARQGGFRPNEPRTDDRPSRPLARHGLPRRPADRRGHGPAVPAKPSAGDRDARAQQHHALPAAKLREGVLLAAADRRPRRKGRARRQVVRQL